MKGVKDERKSHEKAGVVYELSCKTCEKTYTGETARSAYIRGKEHHAHARNGHPELSAVAEHSWTGHDIEWTPSVIASCKNNRERKVKEAWLIHDRERKGKMTMNRDRGVELSKLLVDLVSTWCEVRCKVMAELLF